MDTLTPAHLLRRAVALATAPALVFGLAACGDDDDDSAGGPFCDEAQRLDEEMSGIDEPTEEQLTEVFERLSALDPPDEIADEWEIVMGALDPENLGSAPTDDPEELEELQAASDTIDEYMQDECGL